MKDRVLFVQKRTHRAGAQTCLARLLGQPRLREWEPTVVCSRAGWLTAECERLGVPVVVEEFPSSRSLAARVYQNRAFAGRVAEQLRETGIAPSVVHANDHLEGLLGLELAGRLKARSAIFLRSPGMTRADYFKYRCRDYDLIIAVGDELRDRAQRWDPERKIHLVHDGIGADEFCPLKSRAREFPRRILVIGSPLDWKGWADLTEALRLLEDAGDWSGFEFHFTGDRPDPAKNDLHLERLRQVKCVFLGRVEKFRDLVRDYDLAINPTRMESFGMAAVEVLAAGVPLLSSRSGIIEQILESPAWLFPPHEPQALAKALRQLRENWPGLAMPVEAAQDNIRRKFLVDHSVDKLLEVYRTLPAGGG